jgi:hypothetical protein
LKCSLATDLLKEDFKMNMANFTPLREMTPTPAKQPTPNLKALRERKAELMQEFCIPITPELKAQLKKIGTEPELDRFCAKLIRDYLSDDRLEDVYFSKLASKYYGRQNVRECTIINYIGKRGFEHLFRKGYIKYAGLIRGYRVYNI